MEVYYKEAGDLVPGDVYIERRQDRREPARDYWVIKSRPGFASTIVEVTVECLDTRKRKVVSFYRGNRVQMQGEGAQQP